MRQTITGRLLTLLILTIGSVLSAASERPNILIIFADDLGYEKLSCYGGLETETPVLDEMAEQGMRFTRAYTSAVCTPSRMSFYTGTYVPRHGYTDVLPVHTGSRKAVDFSRLPSYAQVLRDAGYMTSVTGKWQLAGLEAHPEHIRRAGFDSWCIWQIWREGAKTNRYWQPTLNQDGQVRTDIEDRYGPDVLTDYVISRMRKARVQGKPFLIHHNMMLPHFPIHQTPDDLESGQSASLDRMIAYMDKQVGILLRALRDLRLADNTYVFFMGDNGTDTRLPRPTSQGAVTGGKHYLNDGGTHVPLIVWAPGKIPAGRIAGDLVESSDFFPTVCELTGTSLPETMQIDGLSFAGPLLGRSPGKRSFVTAGLGDDFYVFDGEWRLHALGGKLVDCRKLPQEYPADLTTAEAEAALERLQPILEGILQSSGKKLMSQ